VVAEELEVLVLVLDDLVVLAAVELQPLHQVEQEVVIHSQEQ
jgi:hypothetical protein|tara:strand:+ start:189 stop:314 length:126 start_codon:yes stop_codon:yes gene_type:complete